MPQYPPPPPPGIRRVLWEWRVKLESTFVLSMLSSWERGLIYGTLIFITLLFWLSVFTYGPSHLTYLSRRFSYYVFDDETVHVGYALRQWVRDSLAGGLDGVRGAKRPVLATEL